MSTNGIKINRQAIAKAMKEIQREFDKNGPVKIGVEANDAELSATRSVGTVYHGPVVISNGDGAQIAFNNENVTQNQVANKQVALGYELIAEAVAETLRRLPEVGLGGDEHKATEEAAHQVLTEVTKTEPNRSIVKSRVALIKGFLVDVASGATTGAAEGAQELAKTAIEQLGSAAF